MGIRKFTKGILFGLAAFIGVMIMPNTAQAGTLQQSSHVQIYSGPQKAEDGVVSTKEWWEYAWMPECLSGESSWYHNGTFLADNYKVYIGSAPTRTGELPSYQHYYEAYIPYGEEIPVSYWEVNWQNHTCIHEIGEHVMQGDDYVNVGSSYYWANGSRPSGLDSSDKMVWYWDGYGYCFRYDTKCGQTQYLSPGWSAYCSNCGEMIYYGLTYASKEAVSSISTITQGSLYVSNCPECGGAEIGPITVHHKCDKGGISNNGYTVQRRIEGGANRILISAFPSLRPHSWIGSRVIMAV